MAGDGYKGDCGLYQVPLPCTPFKKEGNWGQREDLNEFIEVCRFDIFMRSCQVDYVGSENISKESYVSEVCNNMSKLKQLWKDERGRDMVDTAPEELFQKFVRFAVNLPKDTEIWTIQLPSQFVNHLL